jgi:regulator of nucleoside diphosphate kinase
MISEDLPPIAVPANDYSLLDRLARSAASNKHPVARFLLAELQRANICAEAELPADTVRLNNWVTYRLNWGWPSESRMLVRPQDYRASAAHLSACRRWGRRCLD